MELSQITNYVSAIPKFLTDRLVELISNLGVTVTSRWAGLLLFLITLLLAYIGLKTAIPLLKWSLIILVIILVIGLLIPGW